MEPTLTRNAAIEHALKLIQVGELSAVRDSAQFLAIADDIARFITDGMIPPPPE